MKSRLFVPVMVVALLVGACGIPTDDNPTAFVPVEPTPVAPTPTVGATGTQLFPIYLVDGNNRVQKALRELPDPLTISALIAELTEETTEEERERNLVSIIPAETEFFADPFSEDGTAFLDFKSGTSFDTLAGDQQTLALAQLVWTLNESRSISSVVIRIDGVDQSWPTDEGDKAEPLTLEDYDRFDPEFVAPTPTPDPEPPPEEVIPTPAPGDATPTPG